MNRTPRTVVALMFSALLMLNSACTTTKPIYNVEGKTYAGQLKPGDRVLLNYRDGRVKQISVNEVSETSITGTTHKNTVQEPRGTEVVADWQDIDTVQTVKVSALKTTGLAVGGVAAISALIIAVVLSAFGG